MEKFPSNSENVVPTVKPGSGPKKIEKIIAGEAVRRKMSLGKRLKETFIGGDSRGLFSYLLFEIMLPAAKDVVADVVSQGIERTLYGEARSTSRRTGVRPFGSSQGHVSYNRYSSNQGNQYSYNPGRRDDPREISRQARGSHNFEEIILNTRSEAEEVLGAMFEYVSEYEAIPISALYEMLGITPSFPDEKWGWTDIRGCGIKRVSNGYLLDLSRPEPIR